MFVRNPARFPRPSLRPLQSGFSLVELLVVIAILVILASLLMPGLSRAKETARRVQCVNNLRQLSITWELYAADHEERLVANGYGNEATLAGARLWVVGATHAEAPAYTNLNYLLDPKLAAFADYLTTREIYKCPSDRSTVAIDGKAHPKTRTYALNAYLNWVTPHPSLANLSPRHQHYRRMSDVAAADPANLLQFVDSAPGNVCHSGFVTVLESRTHFYHLPSVAHLGAATFSFVDGHVDWRKWRNPKTIADARIVWESAPHLRWLPDNEDLAWLQERASRPRAGSDLEW